MECLTIVRTLVLKTLLISGRMSIPGWTRCVCKSAAFPVAVALVSDRRELCEKAHHLHVTTPPPPPPPLLASTLDRIASTNIENVALSLRSGTYGKAAQNCLTQARGQIMDLLQHKACQAGREGRVVPMHGSWA